MQASKPLIIGVLAMAAAAPGCDREVSFANDVQPILVESCTECHSEAAEGYETSGFSLVDYEGVIRGTKFGRVVVPGSRMSSSMYLVVAHKTAPEIHMPPHHDKAFAAGRGTSLTAAQIETIGAWIDAGAKDN